VVREYGKAADDVYEQNLIAPDSLNLSGGYGLHLAENTGASGLPLRHTRMLDLKKSTVYRPPPMRLQ